MKLYQIVITSLILSIFPTANTFAQVPQTEMPAECDKPGWGIVDLIPHPSKPGMILAVCKPHTDKEPPLSVMDMMEKTKRIMDAASTTKNDIDNNSNKSPDTQLGGGKFSIWIHDTLTNIKIFLVGTTCPEDNTQNTGSIVSTHGTVYILRGKTTLKAVNGTPLLGGDVVVTQEASNASIMSKASGKITLGEDNKLRIPNYTNPDCHTDGLIGKLGNIWRNIKHKIKGDNYEIRTHTDGVGVRG